MKPLDPPITTRPRPAAPALPWEVLAGLVSGVSLIAVIRSG